MSLHYISVLLKYCSNAAAFASQTLTTVSASQSTVTEINRQTFIVCYILLFRFFS